MPLRLFETSYILPSSKDSLVSLNPTYQSPSSPKSDLDPYMDNFISNSHYYIETSNQRRSKGFAANQTEGDPTWGYFAALPPTLTTERRDRDDRSWPTGHGYPLSAPGRQTQPYLTNAPGHSNVNNIPQAPWVQQDSAISHNEPVLILPDIPSPQSPYTGWEFGSVESQGFPSPSSVGSPPNEYFLDFELPHTLSAENLSLPSDNLLMPPAPSPKLSSSAPSSCLSTPTYRNTQLCETSGSKSRDMSPSGSADGDPKNSRRRFPCIVPGCSRRFTSQYTLKVHVEAHKPKPRVSFPCTLGCSERFSRQHDRLRHEVAKHGKVCEFSCNECGRFFSSQKTLGNHKCPVAQGGTRWVNS